MPTLNNAMNLALTGLKAGQMGLNVAGHNISNVNTEGYTRQELVQQAASPVTINKFSFGTGVDILDISRTRDAFVDDQYRSRNEELGNFQKQAESLSLIEGLINEPSDTSLHNTIKNFFNSMQDLATNPESSSVRATVREQGRAMTTMFNQISNGLQNLQESKNFEITDIVDGINERLRKLSELNLDIARSSAPGRTNNDLADQRDVLLDELSGMVDMNSFEDPATGTVTVTISGQAFVVNGNYLQLETDIDYVNDQQFVKVLNPTDKSEMPISSGELYGLLQIRDETIPDLISELDTLASSIIESVNEIHREGYGIQGSRASIPTNLDFFDGTDASTISLSYEILSDPSNIAASADGKPGDNSNALAIAQLRNAEILNNDSFTFEDYLAGMVSSLGLEAESMYSKVDTQQVLVNSLQNYREQLFGVNMDEELTNLIKYQQSFNAAARVITTVNELMGVVVRLGQF